MKGIVLSFGSTRSRLRLPDFRALVRRHGLLLIFAAVLLSGLVLGAVYARHADSKTLHALDFLFTTNLDTRLAQGAVGTFCACFASDFLFLFAALLLGLAPWGVPFLAALVCFKGFGTGVTAGYLCLSHGVSGAGFYLLVLLPGTFLFCAALTGFVRHACAHSRHALLTLFGRQLSAVSPKEMLLRLTAHFLTALCVTFFASVMDALLWTLFAGTFQF